MRASPVVALALAAVGGGIVAACDDSASGPSPTAQVVEAVVRVAADDVAPDPDRPDALPVVYVVSGSDEPFSARVQASVASAVNDDVDVRFADARDESLESEQPGQPVRDGGVLALVGKVVAEENPMTVDVELYRSTTQFSRRVVTFDRRGEAWEPSEHSVLEEMDVPPTTEAVDAEEASTPPPPTTSP